MISETPLENSGMFFENTIGRFSHNYITTFIDSRDVSITNKARIDKWIEDRGIDSDFVKVRVRGVFPSVGAKQFINSDDVIAASERPLIKDDFAPLVIGVDVARFGADDTVLYPRRGKDARSFEPVILSGLDTVQVTGRVIQMIREFRTLGVECQALFVDGGGLGGGVVDMLRHYGYAPIEVLAQHRPNDPITYRYKTDEMWGEMKQAIVDGLCLPHRRGGEAMSLGAQLFSELTQREFDYTLKAQINLESKADMKDRGLDSPNIADALALTFAQEVAPLQVGGYLPVRKFAVGTVHDPSIWGAPATINPDEEIYRRRGYG